MNNNLFIELSDDSAQNIAGGYGGSKFSLEVYKNEYTSVFKKDIVIAAALIEGNIADSESKATAVGYNTFTSTLNITATTPYSSTSYGGSHSASN
jgi:hypothetical protein